VPQGVRADVLGDPGAPGHPADDPRGAVPVQPLAVRSEEQRSVDALDNRQVDRPGGARRERDGDDLPALATKAFVLSFSEALWGEVRPAGVQVLALCPGATGTEFFGIAGESASVGRRQTPERVVRTALRALDRDRPSVVSGRANSISALMPRLLPRRATIRVARRMLAPRA